MGFFSLSCAPQILFGTESPCRLSDQLLASQLNRISGFKCPMGEYESREPT